MALHCEALGREAVVYCIMVHWPSPSPIRRWSWRVQSCSMVGVGNCPVKGEPGCWDYSACPYLWNRKRHFSAAMRV